MRHLLVATLLIFLPLSAGAYESGTSVSATAQASASGGEDASAIVRSVLRGLGSGKTQIRITTDVNGVSTTSLENIIGTGEHFEVVAATSSKRASAFVKVEAQASATTATPSKPQAPRTVGSGSRGEAAAGMIPANVFLKFFSQLFGFFRLF